MSERTSDDAPHAPTDVHLTRAQERGEIPRSDVLAHAIQVGAVVGLIAFGLAPLAGGVVTWSRQYLQNARLSIHDSSDAWPLHDLLRMVGLPLALAVGCLFIAGCVGHLVQPGLSWGKGTGRAFQTFQPLRNVLQLFAARRWLMPIVGALVLAAAIPLASCSYNENSSRLMLLWEVDPEIWLASVAGTYLPCLWVAAGALLVVGILDYGWQRRQFFRRLHLTDQQLRDEQRREEGVAKSMIKERGKRQRV